MLVAAGAAGLAAGWTLRSARRRRLRARVKLEALLDESAGIAFHVAVHEAESRQHALAPLHLLYGILQEETVAARVATAGDIAALESRVLAGLDARVSTAPPDNADAVRILATAVARARYQQRKATCADLWAAMAGTEAGALASAAGIDFHAVLFALVHGSADPDVSATSPREVLVVIRNDDFSTKEFVRDVLRDVFGLPEAEAELLMETAHRDGRATVARVPAAEASAKIEEARRRARAAGHPLWFEVEPT